MKDVKNDVHHEEYDVDGNNTRTLTDDEKSRVELEQCQQLQLENDLLQAQLAEASFLHGCESGV